MTKTLPKSLAAITASGLAVTSISGPAQAFSPDTFEVTNCQDSGVGSLRSAVEDAVGSSFAQINFDIECNLIELEDMIVFEEQWLQIDGPGASELTIQNSADYDGVLIAGLGNAELGLSGLTISMNENKSYYAEILYSEGAIDLFQVEITGITTAPNAYAALYSEGYFSMNSSSVYGNFIDRRQLIRAEDFVFIDNNSFVGNALFEGTLMYAGNKVIATRNAFVDNLSNEMNAMSGTVLMVSSSSSIYLNANYFVEEIVDSEGPLFSYDDRVNDLGGNIYVLDPGITSPEDIVTVSDEYEPSYITTRDEMKLGDFDRVQDSQYGLSVKVQQLQEGSFAIDRMSIDGYQAVGVQLIDMIQRYGIPTFDAVGERRPSGEKMDAGPFEFLAASEAQTVQRNRKVFFAPMSSKLSKYAKTSLRKMANAIPDDADNIRIKLTGFVQPAGFTWNNKSLSEARAKAVQKFLKKLGVRGTWKLVAKGEDSITTKEARRVEVNIRYVR